MSSSVKLLLFGNPALAMDSLALKVGAALEQEGYETLHLENPLGLLDLDLAEYVILDVAYGVTEVKLLTDVDKLVLGRLCSLHDFDMAYFLKLLNALGDLDEIRIIAIPLEMSEQDAIVGVRKMLETL